MAVLNLNPKFGATCDTANTEFGTVLGDGYLLNARVGNSRKETWNLSAILYESEMLNTVATFEQYSGYVKFQWRHADIVAYKDFYCESWEVSPLSSSVWEISAKFVEA